MPSPYSLEIYRAVFAQDGFAPLLRAAPLTASLTAPLTTADGVPNAPRADVCQDADCDGDPCLAITGLSEAEARTLIDLAFELYAEGIPVEIQGETHTLAIFAARVTGEQVLLLTFELDPFAEA